MTENIILYELVMLSYPHHEFPARRSIVQHLGTFWLPRDPCGGSNPLLSLGLKDWEWDGVYLHTQDGVYGIHELGNSSDGQLSRDSITQIFNELIQVPIQQRPESNRDYDPNTCLSCGHKILT